MIIILGLVILLAAVIAGVAGILANGGQGHQVTHFAVFGYHVTGSTGTLFLYGIITGALAMAGLSILLAGTRRAARRGREARRGLADSRRQTAAVSADRDDLISERDTARSAAASTPGDGTTRSSTIPGQDGPSLSQRMFGRRSAAPPARVDSAAGTPPEPPAAAVPAGSREDR
jgi:hypothetical protein